MLKRGLDRVPAAVQTALIATPAISQAYVRGPECYHPHEEVIDAE
jgi:hypothetical protein